jgi:hypothetical protein
LHSRRARRDRSRYLLLRRRLQELLDETHADEIIATGQIFDHAARLRSFEIAAEQFRAL